MQFGKSLERMLHSISHANPRFGDVHMCEIDLKDGFCRVWLEETGTPNLAVVFPTYEGEEPMVAFPLVLPMGWEDSPPWFCAATETVADLANTAPSDHDLPQHPMERLSETPPEEPLPLPDFGRMGRPRDDALQPTSGPRPNPLPPAENVQSLTPAKGPVGTTDIYVDDFIGLCQGGTRKRTRQKRALFHAIDEAFRPPSSTDPAARQPVPSESKLQKGDGDWATRKTILGWIIDSQLKIIALAPHRYERLLAIFDDLRDRTRVGLKQWHKVLGELRSMVLAIPGGRGLFSLLQTGFKFKDKNRIRITPAIRAQLQDFEHLARDLGSRPTKLSEIAPDTPAALGACDAAGPGMGGVWLAATTQSTLSPLLWRAPFPSEIQARLVSDKNPRGDITNSDLELAGTIGHQDILVQNRDCRDRTISTLSDNIPAVAWQRKGSTTTTGAAAYLLRLNSLHQRHYRYLAQADYIPGPSNVMADDCSRLWHLSDSQLLHYFNSKYPQKRPWQICPLRPEMHSALISALRMKRLDPQSFLNAPEAKTVIGTSGTSSATNYRSTATSMISEIPSRFYKYSLRGYAGEKTPPAVNLYDLARWRTTYAPSARKSPAWGPRTPELMQTVMSTAASALC
jgi:hypothetical protein